MGESSQQASAQLIERIARQINRWKLTAPAIVFLEATKPFSFIASQGLLLGEPLLSFLGQGSGVSDYASLLAERSNVEQLIARLERERRAHGKGEEG